MTNILAIWTSLTESITLIVIAASVVVTADLVSTVARMTIIIGRTRLVIIQQPKLITMTNIDPVRPNLTDEITQTSIAACRVVAADSIYAVSRMALVVGRARLVIVQEPDLVHAAHVLAIWTNVIDRIARVVVAAHLVVTADPISTVARMTIRIRRTRLVIIQQPNLVAMTNILAIWTSLTKGITLIVIAASVVVTADLVSTVP